MARRRFCGRKPTKGHPWIGGDGIAKPPTPPGSAAGPKRRERKGPALRKPLDLSGRVIRLRFQGSMKDIRILETIRDGFLDDIVFEYLITTMGGDDDGQD